MRKYFNILFDLNENTQIISQYEKRINNFKESKNKLFLKKIITCFRINELMNKKEKYN